MKCIDCKSNCNGIHFPLWNGNAICKKCVEDHRKCRCGSYFYDLFDNDCCPNCLSGVKSVLSKTMSKEEPRSKRTHPVS